MGFSNEGVRDGELRGHILLSHNTNITSFLLSRLKEEMRGGEPLAVFDRKHPWVQWGLGVKVGGRGLAHALNPVLSVSAAAVSPRPEGTGGALRQPHFPSYPTIVPRNLLPRALADPPAPSPQYRAW